jgi:hypothetical protein
MLSWRGGGNLRWWVRSWVIRQWWPLPAPWTLVAGAAQLQG